MQPTWQTSDGAVQLYLGDCLDVLPTLTGVDAVVTDPPYGVELKEKTSRYSTIHKAGNVYEDTCCVLDSVVLPAIAISVQRFCRVVVTPGHRAMFRYPQPKSVGTIFSPGHGGRDSWGFGCNNPILYYGKCPYLARCMGSRPNSFASNAANPYGDDEASIDHPCPKPLGWMLWIVNRASLVNDTVCDPFMGSGTTGVACVRTGRKFIGVEKEPKYFEIAVKRIEAELNRAPLFEPAPQIQRQLIA